MNSSPIPNYVSSAQRVVSLLLVVYSCASLACLERSSTGSTSGETGVDPVCEPTEYSNPAECGACGPESDPGWLEDSLFGSMCSPYCLNDADCPPFDGQIPDCITDVVLGGVCMLSCNPGGACPEGTECVGISDATYWCLWPEL